MSFTSSSSGSSLFDKSRANPANVDMRIFGPRQVPAGQGTVSSDYLKRTHEEDPWPAESTPVATSDAGKADAAPAEPETKSVTKLVLSVFTDGTMNDSEADAKTATQTNVAKLYTLIAEGEEQDALHAKKYVVGIGGGHRVDDSSNWASRKLKSAENSVIEGVEGFSGLGFADRIAEAMDWISELAGQNPDAEIAVQIFGFSRGAAEAIHLVNILNDDEELARHKLSGRKVTLPFVGLFDPVASLGLPGNGINPGARLEVRGDMAEVVVTLIAQSEVRAMFPLTSLRVPPASSPGPYSWSPSEWLPDVCFQYNSSNPSALRNPGAAQEAWIPDRELNESLEDYVYRMKDREIDFGAAPRGATSNEFWSREAIEARIKMIYEQKIDRWRQKRAEEASGDHSMSMDNFFREYPLLPKVRSRDNSLARISLWVMIEQAEKAGVKWKRLQDLQDEAVDALKQLPASHVLSYLHKFSSDPHQIEQQLWLDNPTYRNLIVPRIHDSRLAVDIPQRCREVYFCGKKS